MIFNIKKFYPDFSSRNWKLLNLIFKITIGILSIYYIISAILQKNNSDSFFNFYKQFNQKSHYYLISILLIVLMFINWFFEAAKWKFLIARIENISFFYSIKCVFVGITAGIFTPNRIGEIAGRVFMLKKSEKTKSTVLTLIGGFSQLFTTLIMFQLGLFYFFYLQYYLTGDVVKFIVFATINFLLILILLFIFFNFPKVKFLFKNFSKIYEISTYFDVLSKFELIKIWLWSFARYYVFSTQFVIILIFLNIQIPFLHLYFLITLIYGITTIIPTFALTEIGVKSAVSVWVFTWYSNYFFLDNSNFQFIVINGAFFLWIINVVIPALLGLLFISKLNFYQNKN